MLKKSVLLLNFLLAFLLTPSSGTGGNQGDRTLDSGSENQQQAGQDGPTTLKFAISNNRWAPVKVKDVKFHGSTNSIVDGNPVKKRTCTAECMDNGSRVDHLEFAIDLSECNPPLKDPLDLYMMQLDFSYSVGGAKWEPNTILLSFNAQKNHAFYKELFIGGVNLLWLPGLMVNPMSLLSKVRIS